MPWRIHKVNLYANNPDFIKFTLCSIGQLLFLKILSIPLFLKSKVIRDQQIKHEFMSVFYKCIIIE